MSRTALLLIAHGSRHPEANDDLHHFADQLRQRGHDLVAAAFLELAEPDIDTAASNCVAQGAETVVLTPYFLSAGVHVRRDLSAAQERLGRRFANVRFLLAEPLGRHPLLVTIVADRVAEVVPNQGE